MPGPRVHAPRRRRPTSGVVSGGGGLAGSYQRRRTRQQAVAGSPRAQAALAPRLPSLRELKRTPGTPQYAKRQANITRRAEIRAARIPKLGKLPAGARPVSIAALSPTLRELDRITPGSVLTDSERRRASASTRATTKPRGSRPTIRSIGTDRPQVETRTPRGKYLSPFRQRARAARQAAKAAGAPASVLKGPKIEKAIKAAQIARKLQNKDRIRQLEEVEDKGGIGGVLSDVANVKIPGTGLQGGGVLDTGPVVYRPEKELTVGGAVVEGALLASGGKVARELVKRYGPKVAAAITAGKETAEGVRVAAKVVRPVSQGARRLGQASNKVKVAKRAGPVATAKGAARAARRQVTKPGTGKLTLREKARANAQQVAIAGSGAAGGSTAGLGIIGRMAVRGARVERRLADEPGAPTARGKLAGKLAGSAVSGAAKGGKAAVKVVSAPIRHPVKTAKFSLVAEAPEAIATGRPLNAVQNALEGKGTVAKVAGVAKGALPKGDAFNIVRDAIDLPAQVLPAVYLPLAGIVEKAQGRPERLDKLWDDYVEQGLLPGIVQGDKDKILKAFKEHPLFSAIEARGVTAAAGRGAGAAARSRVAPAGVRKKASTEREPLQVTGHKPREREYSRDLTEKAVQVALDRRRQRKQGGQNATPGERARILNERVDRIVASEEGVRRANRGREGDEAVRSEKKSGLKPDERDAAVSLATQGILRSPETYVADLAKYAERLDQAHAQMKAKLPNLAGAEKSQMRNRMDQNRRIRDSIGRLGSKDPEAVFAVAAENAQALQKIDRELGEVGAIDPRQAEQARLIPFAREHMGATYGVSRATKAKGGRQVEQILDRDGNPLSPEKIKAEMRRQGGEPERIGFVSQSPSARGARSFYRGFFPDRAAVDKAKRTGKATEEGTFDPSFDAIVEQRIRGRGIIDAVRGFDRTVQEFAFGNKRFKDTAAARDAARVIEAETGISLRPMRLGALGAKEANLRKAEEIFDSGDQLQQERLIDDLMSGAIEDGPGPVVLVPEPVYLRLKEHFAAAGTFRRAMQVASSAFKGVVLPTSPNWLLGNFIDVNLRSMVGGATPFGKNAALGRKLVRTAEEMDPVGGGRARASLIPGSVYGAAESTRIFRDARQFAGAGGGLERFARAMGTLRRAPGIKGAVDAYAKYRDAVFEFNTRFLEDQAQYAQLGKVARREVRDRVGRWEAGLKIGDDALKDLAQGLLKTENQIKYAKQVERTLGQWTANSPGARAFLVDYAPFGMWTRAATQFVLRTLPVDHPILTAIAASAYEMTEAERDRLGLSHFADRPVPSNMQGSLPLSGGRLAPVQSVSSLGYFADYQASLATAILPQFPLAELAGLDWTGERLQREDGTPVSTDERIGITALAFADAYIPFIRQAQVVGEKGPGGLVPRTVRPYDKGLVDYLRDFTKTIKVQPKGSGSKSSDPFGDLFKTEDTGSNSDSSDDSFKDLFK